MVDRPIIFSAPMVRALLAGRKTQTRRVIKLPTKTHSGGRIYERPDMGGWEATTHGGAGCFAIAKDGRRQSVPEKVGLWHQTTGVCVVARYQSGNRLWVRETCRAVELASGLDCVEYSATAEDEDDWGDPINDSRAASDRWIAMRHYGGAPQPSKPRERGGIAGPWVPSIHMPRWASRLTLIVEEVRVEPLQAISREDAIAEGIERVGGGMLRWENWSGADGQSATSPQAAYALLWNSLHGAAAWDANPWVVALTFRVERGNIDNLERAA